MPVEGAMVEGATVGDGTLELARPVRSATVTPHRQSVRTAVTRVDDMARIGFLDVIRGVAAAVVVVEHFGTHYYAGFQRAMDAFDPGRGLVVAFFLVSGYVIPLSLERMSVPVFAVRRVLRLFPVYWLGLAAFVALNPHYLPGHDPGSPSVALFGLNVLMLNGVVGALSILYPAWSLAIELLFYGQGAVVKLLGRLDRSVRLGWFWLTVFLLGCAAEATGHHVVPRSVPLMLYMCAVGHALYLRDRDGAGRTWLWLVVGGAVVVPLGALIGHDAVYSKPCFIASHLFGIAVFLLMHALREARFPRWLVWSGSLSYGMYLLHPVVVSAIERLHIPAAQALLRGFVITPLLAEVVHRLVEQPCIALGRRLTRRPAPAPARTARTAPPAPPVRRPRPGGRPVDRLPP